MKDTTRFSFEFFPPRNIEQTRRFWRTFGALEPLAPSQVSVTWGALGADSRASLDMLKPLLQETDVPVMAHLSCVDQTVDQLRTTIDMLGNLGVTRILALRGDATTRVVEPDQLTRFRHASDLVTLLASDYPNMDVSVAAYPEVHPESDSVTMDLYWLKHKFECGARQAFTQFFFDADTYLRFRDRAAAIGIDKPLVPGILPIHDVKSVQRFARKCGARVPAALVRRVDGARDAATRQSIAVEVCVRLCRRLAQEGVHDVHLYTLNRAELSRAVVAAVRGQSVDVAA